MIAGTTGAITISRQAASGGKFEVLYTIQINDPKHAGFVTTSTVDDTLVVRFDDPCPFAALPGARFRVRMQPSALADLEDNKFAGLGESGSSIGVWEFTTADEAQTGGAGSPRP
jgi:hypothetical protein